MLEANPRSSRSVPFISKAAGIPLVDLGVQAMMKKSKKRYKGAFEILEKPFLYFSQGSGFPI